MNIQANARLLIDMIIPSLEINEINRRFPFYMEIRRMSNFNEKNRNNTHSVKVMSIHT